MDFDRCLNHISICESTRRGIGMVNLIRFQTVTIILSIYVTVGCTYFRLKYINLIRHLNIIGLTSTNLKQMCKYYIHVTFTGTNLHIHKFMSVANDKMSIYHRGLETNIDSNSSDYYRRFQNTENMDFNEQMSQRQTFWEKNRNLLFLVAGLVVGCFVTVIISYAFFSLGQNKGHGNCQPYGKKCH